MNLRTLVLIGFICMLTHNCSAQKDGLGQSLNDLVNKYIDSALKSLPAKVSFFFFLNGKPVKRSLVFTAHLKNAESIPATDTLIISNRYFTSEDSIYFSAQYKSKILFTNNTHIKNYLHGGKIIFNLITNYPKQLKKYLKDSVEYLNSNSSNYLYRFFLKNREQYKNDQRGCFYFIVLKSNTSYWVTFINGKLPSSLYERLANPGRRSD